MKVRILMIAILILGLFAIQLTAAAVELRKRPPATIVKMVNPNIVKAVGTGMKGTITVGTLPTELKTMTCGDIKVYIGKFVTTPPPAGSDLNLSVPTFQEIASAAATGGIPACSYSIMGVPAGQPLDILVSANQQKFNCTRTSLIMNPAYPKATFTSGQVLTMNFQVTPNCEILR